MTITLIADALVASLLVATIITCYVLAKRIERLKSDESSMRQTIGALITATDTAERAIAATLVTQKPARESAKAEPVEPAPVSRMASAAQSAAAIRARATRRLEEQAA
jgi:hypothetical protein